MQKEAEEEKKQLDLSIEADHNESPMPRISKDAAEEAGMTFVEVPFIEQATSMEEKGNIQIREETFVQFVNNTQPQEESQFQNNAEDLFSDLGIADDRIRASNIDFNSGSSENNLTDHSNYSDPLRRTEIVEDHFKMPKQQVKKSKVKQIQTKKDKQQEKIEEIVTETTAEDEGVSQELFDQVVITSPDEPSLIESKAS